MSTPDAKPEPLEAHPWHGLPRRAVRLGFAVLALWFIGQPLLDNALLRERHWVGLVQFLLGVVVIEAVILWFSYSYGAPYRAALSRVEAANPDALVVGVRLDPLTTPVGAQWADSRDVGWGVLIVSNHGARIVRSDGVVMLDRPWSDFEFSIAGIEVSATPQVEEWWFTLVGDAGMSLRPFFTTRSRRRYRQMKAMRP